MATGLRSMIVERRLRPGRWVDELALARDADIRRLQRLRGRDEIEAHPETFVRGEVAQSRLLTSLL